MCIRDRYMGQEGGIIMFAQHSAFHPVDVSVLVDSISSVHPVIDAHHPTEYLIPGVAQPREGETMSPSQQCADTGRCNAAPSSSYDLDAYERIGAPVIWPAHLSEETGRVEETWAAEMLKQRNQFFGPGRHGLGARMFWRSVQYSTN
eukprot:TRINITY_DN31248_c0_g1_i1.p1 TRINITY_DN31248_c0_g1~~TRINITY_DN31248_c0_g1_i1.p1  ORF type:complete len:147 (+),score=16.99 TRINITY_DN31248_c0_g1_i1:182-622(+)